MHFALKLFGITARPISARHAYENDFSINLPEKKTHLIFVDPVWFAGRKVPHNIISDICAWQNRTGSTVFVDGSFQYMPWDNIRLEKTAMLDPTRTFRMICPTKIMAIHGYRFSYGLIPSSVREEFMHTYTNIYASSAAPNISFALEAIPEMISGLITNKVLSIAQYRYQRLVDVGYISSNLKPDCGYFTFTEIKKELPLEYKLMTQEFFEQKRFDGYAKLNLISPSFYLINPD